MICVGDSLNKNLVINHLIRLLINGSLIEIQLIKTYSKRKDQKGKNGGPSATWRFLS
jgi:hypothetical protein